MFKTCKNSNKKKTRLHLSWLLSLIVLFSFGVLCPATEYYVSVQGSDNNSGAQSSPWRTINYAASQANPGDTVYVRGGTYYEEVRTYRSGTANNRITFKAYPNETPIVDGTAPATGWQKCTSSTDFVDHNGNAIAGRFPGNPNYQNIYKATISSSDVGYGSDIHVYEDGTYLMRSGLPKQLPDNYVYDNIEQYQDVDPSCYGQSNYIIDLNRNEPDGFWVGAKIRVYLYNNNHHVAFSTVVGWDQSEHKFTLSSSLPATLTSGGTIADCYKLENHWGCLTQLGEAYHTTNAKDNTYTVYVWPRRTAELSSNVRISKYDRGFEFVNNKDDYITVDGFTFRGFTKGPNSGTHGSFGVGNISAYPHTGAEIKNCKILNCAGTAGITMWCGTEDVYENNIVDGCRSGYGIACRGLSTTTPTQRCKINGNTINHIRSTSIKVIYSNNIQITRNKVGKSGSHGNACSLYMRNKDVLFAHNITTESNSGVTMQDSENIYIVGNALHATADNVCVAWPDSKDTMRGDVYILGNTIQRGEDKGTGGGLGFSTAGYQATYVAINNIIDGAMYSEDVLDVTRHHNLYTDYSWKQKSKYGWALATGEIYNDNYTAVFNDPVNYDYSIQTGSPADNKGTNISAYLPTDKFPDYDFSVDLYGTPRGTPSIGACEGGSSDGETINPPVANAGGDQTVPYNDRENIQLTGTSSTGYAPLAFEWSLSGNVIATGNSPVISLSNPGSYNILLTVKDGQNPFQQDTDTITITVQEPEVIAAPSNVRDGLVAEWMFSTINGTSTSDGSYNGNDVILSDEGMWNQDGNMDFTSTQTYLKCDPVDSLNLTRSLTLAAWINPRSFGEGNYGRIIDKGNGSAGRGFSLLLNGNSGDIGYLTYGSAYASSNNDVISLNTWTHICVVYDELQQVISFYINGQEAGSSSYTSSPADALNDPLYIGLRGYDNRRNFDGLIDGVCLYNRSLEVDEVQELYTAGKDGSLIGKWLLDDYTGIQAHDSSGYGYAATLQNGPEWGCGWAQEDFIWFNGTNQAAEIDCTAMQPQSGTIVMLVQPETNNSLQFLFGHTLDNTNYISLYTVTGKLALGLGNNILIASDIAVLESDAMYHVALTWEGTTYAVYVEGQQMAGGTFSGLTALAPTADIANMGTPESRTQNLGLDGIVDDVQIFNRALPEKEIVALWNTLKSQENHALSICVSEQNLDGNATYTAANLPSGATFDFATQTLSWKPWYNQAGDHQVVFESDDQSEKLKLVVSVQDVTLENWYREFLSQTGKI